MIVYCHEKLKITSCSFNVMLNIKFATVLWYMLVTCGLPVSVWFPYDPCFIRRYFSSVFHCSGNVHGWVYVYFIQSVIKERVRTMNKRGWGRAGSCRWLKILLWCERKIIMVRDLLRQYEAWSWVPVRFLVLQVTGETSSANNVGERPRNRDCNPDVDPYMYVWKGFLYFCHHELN